MGASMFDKIKNSYSLFSVRDLIEYCKYMQSQDKCGPECIFWNEHKGCYFRQGYIPREWENK